MHIHVPFIMYCSRLFVVFFPRKKLFTYFYVRQVTELISQPSFMCVSAAVSELRESNQNKKKKNSEIGYFQFNTFPGHIIYSFFNQKYLLSTCMHSIR